MPFITPPIKNIKEGLQYSEEVRNAVRYGYMYRKEAEDRRDIHYCLHGKKIPFFDMKESQEYKLRDEALKKYYDMLIVFFISSCKLISKTSDEIILNAVNASIIHLNNILATRSSNAKLLPLAKQVYDSYNLAIAKLLKAGLKENASQLERLRYHVFMHWTAVRTQ